ncbi:MAG TPA: GTPase HflX [Chloroflexi bacterium]|nr:GTPase HflX [Chloroflexota bacterium]
MTNSDRYHYTETQREQGFLVGVEMRAHRYQNGLLAIEDSLEELAALADTAGVEVVGGTIQRLNKPKSATFIGSGKVEELKAYRDELQVDVFIFDDELSPRQQRGLEKSLDVKVLDRTALILDIFARHAQTREGQLQVELAQLEYRLPRLTRMWTHLARQAGGRAGGATGGVGVRGPGETQLEVDRREINKKIAHLKETLEKVRAHRARHRARRRQSNILVVAIVGYTNAGKSTLLNALMQRVESDKASIYVADQLFATLDPTTRQITLPQGKEILFSDTVGFIQKLPTRLVVAFRATLEEIAEADVLLHVLDITHPNALEHARAVEETLRELNAADIPIITVFNKIDVLEEELTQLQNKLADYADSIPISAKTGRGTGELLQRIEQLLQEQLIDMTLRIPFDAGQLVSLLHEQATIKTETYDEFGAHLTVSVPEHLLSVFEAYREA